MPLEETVTVQFVYDEGDGPVRNGVAKKKPALHPNLDGTEGVEDLLRMMEGVCEWGQMEFHNDHGRQDEHTLLLNTLNLALRLVPGAEALAGEQFGLT